MKRILTIFVTILVCGTILAGCGNNDNPEQVLAGYSNNQSYSDGDESSTKQDFQKYTYDESYDSKFSKDNNYTKVTSKNINKIKGFFDDFEKWASLSSFSDKYDFKNSMITEGDYYCIADETVTTDTVGQRKAVKTYRQYSIYYYDTETHTLYYIQNDIT